jgi:glycosyltransferase involved in cell wall biosynthesis
MQARNHEYGRTSLTSQQCMSFMNSNFTAVVFTKNEQDRLQYIYRNLRPYCPIIVYDDHSTDRTKDFCIEHGIQFVTRPAEDDTGMRNNVTAWVLSHAPTEYILQVYAAHFYPKDLLKTFIKVAEEGKLDAVYHDTVIYRYGKVVHKPFIRRRSSACVFYRKTIINFKGAKLHDELAIKYNPETMIRLPAEDNLALHLFQDVDTFEFSRKTIRYASIEARQQGKLERHQRMSYLVLIKVLSNLWKYFRLGSISRGNEGLAYFILNLIYDINIILIRWELSTENTIEDARIKSMKTREGLIAKLEK